MSYLLSPGLKWNQAKIGDPDHFTNGLIMILAFDSERQPYLLGNGFIIAAFGHKATACTTAHLFTSIKEIQHQNPLHHPTALREFLPTGVPLKINCELVRAIVFKDNRVEAVVIDWVLWDETSDIAFLNISLQNKSKDNFFESSYQLDGSMPALGDEVVILGFGRMETQNEFQNGSGFETFTVKSQLTLLGGSISKTYPDGCRLCKGNCIETTIPVMPGMSGSPVMKFGNFGEQIRPFGLVSSDISVIAANEKDRTISGSSIIPIINSSVNWFDGGQCTTMLKIDQAFWTCNPEKLHNNNQK